MHVRSYARTWITVLVVSLVAFAGTAQADEAPSGLPLNRPAANGMTESVEVVAEQYWSREGIALTPGVELFTGSFTQLGNQIAVAELGGRRIWMNGFLFHPRTIEQRAQFCHVYLHERGHTAGLLDNDGWPVMDYWHQPGSFPYICWEWARANSPAVADPSPARRS